MLPSVRAMFTGIIDYAGMFPPTNLSLEQAIRNYARYRQEPESWMLGRLVCPFSHLRKLWPHVRAEFPPDAELHISALAGGANTAADIRAGFAADLQPSGAIVDSFEFSLSSESVAVLAGERLTDVDPGLGLTTAFTVDDWPHYYYEIPPGPKWATSLKVAIDLLSRTGDQRRGIKLRCGGAAAIPSCEDVATAIAHCRAASVPLKFTAGLHHPMRHYDAALKTHVHGFLSVFGAGILGYANSLDAAQLGLILSEEEHDNFVFEADSFRWKHWRASVEQIEAARRHLVRSFGSCSFDEPRHDLRSMGLIP